MNKDTTRAVAKVGLTFGADDPLDAAHAVMGRFRPELLHMGKLQAVKVLEEAAETVEAYKAHLKDPSDERRRRAADEIADVMQTLVNLMAVMDLTPNEVAEAADRVNARNRERGCFAGSDMSDGGWEDDVTGEYLTLAACDAGHAPETVRVNLLGQDHNGVRCRCTACGVETRAFDTVQAAMAAYGGLEHR